MRRQFIAIRVLGALLGCVISDQSSAQNSLKCLRPELQKISQSKSLIQSDFNFIEVTLLAYGQDTAGAHAAMMDSCDELAPIQESETAEKAQSLIAGKFIGYFDLITSPVKGFVLSDARAAYTRGDETELLRNYSHKLDVMSGRTSQPFERLKFTTEISLQHQGEYDMKRQEIRAGDFMTRLKAGVPFYFTSPQEILQSVADTGKGGTCDEISTLLGWSILRTSRYAYGSRRVYGNFHVWNRVYISGKTIDLDNTAYRRFTPLFPRKITGLNENRRSALYATCQRVLSCLSK